MPASSHCTDPHPPTLLNRVNPFSCLHLDVLIIVLIICPFGFSATSHASCNQLDRDSLVSFSKNITILSSSSPLNWSISVDCCAWEGVICDISGRVTSLRLPSRGLFGRISPSVANLSHLSELNLTGNSLTGNFPDGFFISLNRLQIIDLSCNRLSGQLPTFMFPAAIEIANFSSNSFDGNIQRVFLTQAINLVSFDVSNNDFFGLVPTFICSISHSIRVLDFSNNRFSGSVPQDVGNCSSLETLRAGLNYLSGPLPKDIYKLSKLQELSFPGNNLLNGSLGNDIARLENLRLLDLSTNEFNGIIPPEIGALSNLERLSLNTNNFIGKLPPSLTNCARLALLNLRFNLFIGDLSKFDFSKFAQLATIDLGNNFFNGSIPRSLFACKSLAAVRLDSNQLTGEIPPNIQAPQSLAYLSISNNSLTNVTGAISILSRCRSLRKLMLGKNFYNELLPVDDSLVYSHRFQNLQVLGLGGCFLNGQIPSWLAKLPKLMYLDLSNNDLSGSIPSWMGTLPNLFYLDLSENSLSGNFPPELTKLPWLTSQQDVDEVNRIYSWELSIFIQPDNLYSWKYNQLTSLPSPAIYIQSNNLNGNIPSEIGRLKFLYALNLSDNFFSGDIPYRISYLANLETLDLSRNHFSGEIPASLESLRFLSYFSVSDNDLQGPIPTGGQFLTFPSGRYQGNKGLCGQILERPCPDRAVITNPSRTEKINTDKIIFAFFVGISFGFGFAISTLALRNYEIKGSFLHATLKKFM